MLIYIFGYNKNENKMKKVQLLRRDRLGKINWEDLFLNGSLCTTEKPLDEIRKFLDYYNIPYIDIRLV